MKEQLAKLRTGLRMISGSPSPQALRDRSQRAGEQFLSGEITQEQFRQVITENEYLRIQGEAFALARPKIQAQEHNLDPSLTLHLKSYYFSATCEHKKIVLALQSLVFHYTTNFLTSPGVAEMPRAL